jgi:hypothetical protein
MFSYLTGLIMGGYFSETWRLSISPEIEKDTISLQRQETFNRLQVSLETIPYLLHDFFNNQVWKDNMCSHSIQRPDSLQNPLLFHIFKTHTSFYSFDFNLNKTDISPDISDIHYATSLYTFSVDSSTLLWKIETKCSTVLITEIPARFHGKINTTKFKFWNLFFHLK